MRHGADTTGPFGCPEAASITDGDAFDKDIAPRNVSFRTPPALQVNVTLDALDQPLGELLADLSRRVHVHLITSHDLEDQRISLCVVDQPLHRLMQRLTVLLGHGTEPSGYHWEQLIDEGSDPPGYLLWRDAHALEQERLERDYPRWKASQQLREFRNGSRLTQQQRATFTTSLDPSYFEAPEFEPFRQAVSGLTDAQLETLIEQGSVPLDPTLFPQQIAEFNDRLHANLENQRADALKEGHPDPFPEGIPDVPAVAPAITFHVDDYDGAHPERETLFGLNLEGVALIEDGSMHIVFTPLDNGQPPFTENSGPEIDLSAALSASHATAAQRSDIGFTLRALARVAKIDLYQEEFYKTVYWGARSNGLRALRGTLPQLMNAICKEWGYKATKVGNDYLFWSRTWALDRANDISDRLLTPWREQLKKQGYFSLEDRIEMASVLNWPQLRLTLDIILPETGPWQMKREVEGLRFLGHLNASERRALTSPEGLPVTQLAPWAQQMIVALLGRNSRLETSQLNQAALFLEEIGSSLVEHSLKLELKSPPDSTLWETVVGRVQAKPGKE